MVATLWISANQRSQAHREVAQALEVRGEFMRAASHYQWSARAYAPFSSVGESSLQDLWRLQTEARAAHRNAESLHCLDLIRGAIWSTRWLLNPYDKWGARVDQEIATLRGTGTDEVAALKRSLADDPRPSTTRSFVLLLSILSLLIISVSLFTIGLDTELNSTSYTQRCLLALCISSVFMWGSLSVQ